MRKKNYNKYSYYATILFVISFVLITYGLILDYKSGHSFIDPINDVISTTKSKDNTIHIDTSDDVSNTTSEDSGGKSSEKTPTADGSKSNNTNSNSTPAIPSNDQTQEKAVVTIEQTNNQLRKEIEHEYGITIKYGEETRGYSVSGISTEVITDPTVITDQLIRLKESLNLYPSGLFREIKNGGIPLTVMLIKKYSENSVTGITDSSYSDATISISAEYTFEESFYHESYHYIERYLFKRGANYNSWDSLNPGNFAGWGTIDGSLSYSNTFQQTAPFVNNYAQTAAVEDRASTFEYMMAPSKASCLNNGNVVWKKAKLLADTMDLVLSSVSPDVTEHWERFL